eukprot:15232922-Ditylum_brightwellii.AAC.1
MSSFGRRLVMAFNKVVLPDFGGPRTMYALPVKEDLHFWKMNVITCKDVDRAETWNRSNYQ